ncbi:hypothetical protein [Ralstonia pseudosolanacearum]|uniref:hypothetical protein n=2 Tax=Ralstonia pseudosolanacearum TaxID=1310165 RepID=UPI002676A494|nr:hypothetical protein [Ralstonia pseudosolanacearum]
MRRWDLTEIHMHARFHLIGWATFLATACTVLPQPTHDVTVENPTYDPAVSARVRFLSSNGGAGASFRPGEGCYKEVYAEDNKRVSVIDGFWAAWKYSSRSVTIGMPESPRPNMRVEGLQFKDFIKEYVVPAAKPFTVTLLASSCTPPAVTFVPEPGKDYDIFMQSDSRRCWVSVKRIDDTGTDEPVPLERAPKCPAS